ncbi:MAG: lipid-A-disaccharide synthase [Bacteroidota bacterium]
MKYYLIAGEASGDLHGSNLLKALKKEDPTATFRCWGGDLMAAAGATLVKHYRELAFMGFLEVVKNLPTIARNFRFCKKDILDFQPDVLILIDYPGFNLRMATWAKKQGIRVFYYISPQLWAWHTSRVKIIREAVDRMFVILPFEKDFYQKHGVEVDFAGHPLMDVIALQGEQATDDFFEKNGLKKGKPIVALLPGSRRQEITRMLGTMLQMPALFPDYQFIVAGAPSVERSFYEPFLKQNQGVFLVENQTYALLRHAAVALVTSGTATLETALFNVAQVVCYRGNKLSYLLARLLVSRDLKFISMVNLLAERQLVAELIQDDLTVEKLAAELKKLLEMETRREILEGYAEIRKRLGEPGASARVAKRMVELG